MLRAGKERGQKKPAISQSVTENGKALFHFSALLQSHTGNPPRPWKGNTLALLQKWACLWLLLISGFVCAATGSSYGFAGDPQAFCVISRSGFCSAPQAIYCHAPFVLALHARFGRRSRITGNTAITGKLPPQQLLTLKRETDTESPYQSQKVRCVLQQD